MAENLAAGKRYATSLTASDAEIYHAAIDKIKPTKKSLLHVLDEYMRTWEPDTERLKVREVFASYQKKKNAEERPISKFYANDLKYRMRSFLETFGERWIDEIKADEVRGWLETRESKLSRKQVASGAPHKKWRARTKNNYVGLLRTFWNFARKRKALPDKHHALDEIEVWSTRNASYSLISADDLLALFAFLAQHKGRNQLIPYLALQAFGGLRVEEAKRISWEDVIVENGKVVSISVNRDAAKTRSRRVIDVNDTLADHLYEFSVLRKMAGKIAVWTKIDLVLHRVARANGIEWKHNQIRHTCATHMLRLHKNPAAVAYQLGTSPQMLAGHYSEIDVSPSETSAWFSIKAEIPPEIWDEFAANVVDQPATTRPGDKPSF